MKYIVYVCVFECFLCVAWSPVFGDNTWAREAIVILSCSFAMFRDNDVAQLNSGSSFLKEGECVMIAYITLAFYP